MEVVIACAGKQAEWNGYLGIPKHFVNVDGEPLLARTVRQLHERGITPFVVAEGFDERYALPHSTYSQVPPGQWYGQGRIRSSQHLWSMTKRTVSLLGDVYFTDSAIDSILAECTRTWCMHGRREMSHVTGCQYGEVFAMSFIPELIPRIEYVSDSIIKDIEIGKLTHGASHWDLYDRLVVLDGVCSQPGHWSEIDDWTEDFDYPEDYTKWTERRRDAGRTVDPLPG